MRMNTIGYSDAHHSNRIISTHQHAVLIGEAVTDEVLHHSAACRIQTHFRGYHARTHLSHTSQLTVLAFDEINKLWAESNLVRVRKLSCTTSETTDIGDDVWWDNNSWDGNSDSDSDASKRAVDIRVEERKLYEYISPTHLSPPFGESNNINNGSDLEPLHPHHIPSDSTPERLMVPSSPALALTPVTQPLCHVIAGINKSPSTAPDNSMATNAGITACFPHSPPQRTTLPVGTGTFSQSTNAAFPSPFPALDSVTGGSPSFEHWCQTAVFDSPSKTGPIAPVVTLPSNPGSTGDNDGTPMIPTPEPVSVPESTTPRPVQQQSSLEATTNSAVCKVQAFFRGYFVRTRVICEEVAHLRLVAEAIAEMQSCRCKLDEEEKAEAEAKRIRADKALLAAEKIESKKRYMLQHAKAEKAESKRLYMERRRATAAAGVSTSSKDVDTHMSAGVEEKENMDPCPNVSSVADNGVELKQTVCLTALVTRRKAIWVPSHTWEDFLELIKHEDGDLSVQCAATVIQALFRGHWTRRHSACAHLATHVEMWREAVTEMKLFRQECDRQAAEMKAAEMERLSKLAAEQAAVLQTSIWLATKLQSMYYGIQTRKHVRAVLKEVYHLKLLNQMVVRVQALVRGYRVRARNMFLRSLDSKWVMLFVRIQALVRGHRARKLLLLNATSGTTTDPPCLMTAPAVDAQPVAVDVTLVPSSVRSKGPFHIWEDFLELIKHEEEEDGDGDLSVHCAATVIQALFRGHWTRRHSACAHLATHVEMWREAVTEMKLFRSEQIRMREAAKAVAETVAREQSRRRAASLELRRIEREQIMSAASLHLIQFQAHVRGALCRSTLQYAKDVYSHYLSACVIQALYRGHKGRILVARLRWERALLEFESVLAVSAIRTEFTLEAMALAEAESESVYLAEISRLELEANTYRLCEERLLAADTEATSARAASEERLTQALGSEMEHILILRSLDEEEGVPEPQLWIEEEAKRLGDEEDMKVESLLLEDQLRYCQDHENFHRACLLQTIDSIDSRIQQSKSAALCGVTARVHVVSLLNGSQFAPPLPWTHTPPLPDVTEFDLPIFSARFHCDAAEREALQLDRQMRVHKSCFMAHEERLINNRNQQIICNQSALFIQCRFRVALARNLFCKMRRSILCIQRSYRCFRARLVFSQKSDELKKLNMQKQVVLVTHVTRLQALFRRRRARKESVLLFEAVVQQEQEAAATQIQTVYRGHLIRKYLKACFYEADDESVSASSLSSSLTDDSSMEDDAIDAHLDVHVASLSLKPSEQQLKLVQQTKDVKRARERARLVKRFRCIKIQKHCMVKANGCSIDGGTGADSTVGDSGAAPGAAAVSKTRSEKDLLVTETDLL